MNWKVIALAALGLALSFHSQADEKTLQVSGQGIVAATPDAYTLTMVIEERGAVVSKLNEQANAKLNAVVSFLLSRIFDHSVVNFGSGTRYALGSTFFPILKIGPTSPNGM